MSHEILGIHHISAIAGVAQKNVDFYVGILGLRMVKRTVNFDAPDGYHFYYGDENGNPGTVMTFFPFGEGPRGTRGAGQATVTSFSIRPESKEYWIQRLRWFGVSIIGPEESSGQKTVLSFRDPDGIEIELVAHEGADQRPGRQAGPVPAEHSIRGFYSVEVKVKRYEQTSSLLMNVMGFRLLGRSDGRDRYEVGPGGAGTIIDVVHEEGARLGRNSIGTIHHVAWQVANEEELIWWQAKLMDAGMHVTEVKDRNYFQSIYFREPGGVLFELATSGPGFAIDETVNDLGSTLKLPNWLESSRSQLEAQLVPIHLPTIVR